MYKSFSEIYDTKGHQLMLKWIHKSVSDIYDTKGRQLMFKWNI